MTVPEAVQEALFDTLDGGLQRLVTAHPRDPRDVEIAYEILNCRSRQKLNIFEAIYDICFCFLPSDDRFRILTIALDMIYRQQRAHSKRNAVR